MNFKAITAAAAFVAAGMFGGAASASFLGETVRADAHFPTIPGSTTAGPVDAVVGAGVEFSDGQFTPFFGPSFDFGATSILITHAPTGHNGGTFNGYAFSDLFGTIADIVAVTIVSDNSGFFSGDPSRITWDLDTIFINFESLQFGNIVNPEILLSVTFGDAAVPIPAALPLFASGLAGIGFMRRRRRQTA